MTIRLNMLGLARPVRMVDRSSRLTDTAFSIFSSASKRVSSIISAPRLPSRCDQRSNFVTRDGPSDIAIGQEVENQNRHAIGHAQAERGGGGHLHPAGVYFPGRDGGGQ